MSDDGFLDDETKTPPNEKKADEYKIGKLEGVCIHCGLAMGNFLGTQTPEGPLHNECVPAYKRLHIERCAHCDRALPAGKRAIVAGVKLHPECAADFKAKKPYVPPSKSGILQKFAIGRSFFGSKNWKQRYFVLSPKTGLSYYDKADDFQNGGSPKGVVTFCPRARLITHPTRMIHREALNPSKEFIVVFFEGNKERRLLIAASSWQEHDEWTAALESYIKIIDDPKDVHDS